MKAIFIDRDGVINKDPGGWTEYSYVTSWKEFHFLPGVFEALKLLNKNDIKVIIISNQAGVNKGYFSIDELNKVTAKMMDEINKNGGAIEDVYYCTHKDEDNCSCRKPKPGLLERAAAKYGIDMNKTFFTGDSEVDVIAGRLAGCKTIFLLSGKTPEKEMRTWKNKPDHVFNGLLEAVQWILAKEHRKVRRASRREREEAR